MRTDCELPNCVKGLSCRQMPQPWQLAVEVPQKESTVSTSVAVVTASQLLGAEASPNCQTGQLSSWSYR
ncbi:unnamed protein product [Ixodes pacificus]